MKTADLSIGDRVLVKAPYCGGQGWGEVRGFSKTPQSNPSGSRSGTVFIRFELGYTIFAPGGQSWIPPRWIVKKKREEE